MLKEYSISDLFGLPSQHIPYYAGTFEGTEDTDIEWPHRHAFYSVVWFTKGSGFYVIDAQEYQIAPSKIFLVNPKQVHNWNYSENSEGYILVVDHALGVELNIDSQFPFIDLDQTMRLFLEPVFKNLISVYEANQHIEIDIRYLYKLLERFANSNSKIQINSNPVFDQFKSLIISDIEHNHLMEDYAKSMVISINELNMIIKHVTGVSGKQYLLDLKITEAKRLLLYSSININEIAFRLGFDDNSYFSRIFKKKTSFSPSDFLKKYRK